MSHEAVKSAGFFRHKLHVETAFLIAAGNFPLKIFQRFRFYFSVVIFSYRVAAFDRFSFVHHFRHFIFPPFSFPAGSRTADRPFPDCFFVSLSVLFYPFEVYSIFF